MQERRKDVGAENGSSNRGRMQERRKDVGA